jgi:hypothetical protein
VTRLYHPGDGSPIVLGWDPGVSVPRLQLADLAGRSIPVTVRAKGPLLEVRPRHPLQSGVYIARIP